jgi:hypothetical protein
MADIARMKRDRQLDELLDSPPVQSPKKIKSGKSRHQPK